MLTWEKLATSFIHSLSFRLDRHCPIVSFDINIKTERSAKLDHDILKAISPVKYLTVEGHGENEIVREKHDKSL